MKKFYFLFLFFNFFLCSQEDKKKLNIVIYGSEPVLPLDKFYSLGMRFTRSSLKKIENKGLKEKKIQEYKGKYWKYIFKNIYDQAGYKNFYGFNWGNEYDFLKENKFVNGPLSSMARREAGKALYLMISDYSSQNNIEMKELDICIFGFSHGGNVASEFIKEIKQKKNDELKIKQLFFFETPKTEKTEELIHYKNSKDQYIAEDIIDINCLYPKSITQIIDLTASFPCCARTFLYPRENLFELTLKKEQGYFHGDILDESFAAGVKNFYKGIKEKNDLKKDAEYTINLLCSSEPIHWREKKTVSKNLFRWLLYYRKIPFSIVFLYLVQKNNFLKAKMNKLYTLFLKNIKNFSQGKNE